MAGRRKGGQSHFVFADFISAGKSAWWWRFGLMDRPAGFQSGDMAALKRFRPIAFGSQPFECEPGWADKICQAIHAAPQSLLRENSADGWVFLNAGAPVTAVAAQRALA